MTNDKPKMIKVGKTTRTANNMNLPGEINHTFRDGRLADCSPVFRKLALRTRVFNAK